MTRRFKWLTGTTALLAAVGAWFAFGEPPEEASRRALAPVQRIHESDPTADELFGLTRVHRVHLTLAGEEYAAMQPLGGRGPHGGPGGPPRAAASEPAPLPAGRTGTVSNFGMTFPWAHGALEIDDRKFEDVGVRYKGNASYMHSADGLKRSLKIDLDQFHKRNNKFHGEKKLNLHAAVMDPSKCREAIAYAVFRASGVAASRTAYATVELTVPGEYERERLGLYVIVEQVDKSFLRQHFGDGDGLLMKPERVRGFDYLGENWSAYEASYQPDDPPTAAQSRRVIDFAKLIHRGSDDDFRRGVESYLEVDSFLRFVAVSGFLSNLDGFLASGHNYYVYLNPLTNKFTIFPWDMDLSLGGFPMGGSQSQQMNLSLAHPYNENKLIERVLAIPQYRAQYDAIVRQLLGTSFTRGRMIGYVEVLEAVTLAELPLDHAAADARGEHGFSFHPFGGPARPPRDERPAGNGPGPADARGPADQPRGEAPRPANGPPGGGPRGPGPMGFGPDLRTFIVQRFDSIEAQLAGREEGYIPSGMRMPGGGPGDPGGPGRGGPGQPGGPGERFVKAIIDKADQNADGTITEAEFQAAALAIFQGVDKPESDELDKEGVRNAINSVLPAPSGVMAGLGFGLPSGGPGRFMADPLIAAVDDDGNRLVSQEEWTSGAKRLFKTLSGAKADDAGSKAETAGIDEATLTQNLFSILPHPPGMGPPGMGPPNVGSSRGRDDAGRSARDRGPSGRDSGDRPRGEERPRGDERPSGEERPRRDDRESRRGPPRAGERRGGDERSRGGRGNEPPRSNVRPERPRAPTDDEPTR